MFDPEKFGEAMGLAIKEATAPLIAQIKDLQQKLGLMEGMIVVGLDGAQGLPGDTGERGAQGEKGADGTGLAGAFIDRDGALVLTLSNGEAKSLGKVVGHDGKDGADGLSLDAFDLEYLPETHEISVKAACAGRTKELRYPAGGIRPAGYWREGTKAIPGEAWVHGGSLWIAIKGTEAKPATNADAWIIAARAGRDGERGANGKPVDNSPIKLAGYQPNAVNGSVLPPPKGL